MSTLLLIISSWFILFIVVGILLLSLCIWAIADLFRNNNFDTTSKAVWVLIIAMFPVFGSLIYLLIARNRPRAR